MSTDKTPAEILADLEQQIAAKRTEIKGADPETAQKIANAKNDLEYLGLVQKFDALGKQDQKYAIVDVTDHGKGFVVLVTSQIAEVHRKTIQHLALKDELTDAKVLEITRTYVKHPSLETFDATVAEMPAVLSVCWAAISDLWGARAKIRRAK